MGYILPMTFLPMVARLQVEPGDFHRRQLAGGGAGNPALALAVELSGVRLGDDIALRLSYLTQLLGVLAALLLPGPSASCCVRCWSAALSSAPCC